MIKIYSKIILGIFIFIGLIFLIQKISYAQPAYTDLNIICDNSSEGSNASNCRVFTGADPITQNKNTPLFQENEFPNYDLKPGDDFTKTLRVTNARPEICYFTLTGGSITTDTETPLTSGNYFSQKLMVTITDGVQTIGPFSFYDLFNSTPLPLYLTTLSESGNAGDMKELAWRVTFDKNAGNEYQLAKLKFNFDWNFECGEKPLRTELFIDKTNDTSGIIQEPGDDVTYTLHIFTNKNDPVYNVFVLDLPPGGFTYRPGSWTANSNFRGNLRTLGTTTEPTYASPGKWNLGDMTAGEVVTLTYVADISSSQQPGDYKDIAWTEGTTTSNASSARVMGNISTGFFVGTAAAVDIPKPSDIKMETEVEEKIVEEEGGVLGTSILPATGSDNMWMMVILDILGIGIIFLIIGLILRKNRKSKIINTMVIFLMIFLLSKNQVFAQNLLIRLEDPKNPNNLDTLKINFVTMDTENRTVLVKCYKQGPSDGGFSQFGSDIITISGGNSGYCEAGPSILDKQGNYNFYATAEVSGDSSTSQTITITHDNINPKKPEYIKKDKNGSCKYDIKLKTGDDSGDTTKVEVYRSDEKEFEANDSTRIRDISTSSNTIEEFTDDKPNCGKTYYYGVIAFDSAGNRSNPQVEELEKEVVVITLPKEITQQPTIVGTTGAIALGESETAQVLKQPATIEEEQPKTEENQQKEEVLGQSEEAKTGLSQSAKLMQILKLPIIIGIIMLILIYVINRAGKSHRG